MSLSPSPQPRPRMPARASSSSRRSSAIYQLPVNAPALQPLAPPAPPPEHYVFFPCPLPGLTAAHASNAETFVFGWQRAHAAVVAGAIHAVDSVAAQVQLSTALRGQSHDLEIIGRCLSPSAKGKEKQARPCAGEHFVFESSLDNLPRIHHSPHGRSTIVTYSPPNRAQLQFLSLVPLQLDLNSFISPMGAKRAAKGAVDDTDREERAKMEQIALADKIRHASRSDFSSRTNAEPVATTDLAEVIDWVRNNVKWI